jgi:membrane protease subunit HflC
MGRPLSLRLVPLAVGAAVVGSLLSTTLLIVDQDRYAVVYSLGELREVIREPGLHVKMPPPFQNAVLLDRRLQTLDTSDGERYLTLEKKEVLVDAFVKWKIADPRQFMVAVGTGDRNAGRGADRLAQVVRTALGAEIAKRNLHDLNTSQREQVGAAVGAALAREARDLGVQIVDVRVRRIGYTDQVANGVIERMKAERARIAAAERATGNAEGEEIRANAERQRTEIEAEARQKAQTAMGEGDARAAQIYAQSFGKNPEFYRFYRSLEAYRETFKSRNDVLVLDPSSEFFKYFRGPGK